MSAGIRVIVVRVGSRPVVEWLQSPSVPPEELNYLPAMQAIVGGLVDVMVLPDGCDLWFNDEGLLLDLPPNREVPNWGFIVGDFFIARTTRGGELAPVTDGDVAFYLDLWNDGGNGNGN